MLQCSECKTEVSLHRITHCGYSVAHLLQRGGLNDSSAAGSFLLKTPEHHREEMFKQIYSSKSVNYKHDSSNIRTWKMVLAVVESFVVLDVAFVVKLIALKKEVGKKKHIKKNHNWCECQRSYRICPLMGEGKVTAKTNGDYNMLTLPQSPGWVVGSTGWGALVAEGLEEGTACGTVCITMDPCGLMICCPGADTICRTLPKSTINATNISIKNHILILTPIP